MSRLSALLIGALLLAAVVVFGLAHLAEGDDAAGTDGKPSPAAPESSRMHPAVTIEAGSPQLILPPEPSEARGGPAIIVTVLADGGKPLAGARGLTRGATGWNHAATTDEAGRMRLSVPARATGEDSSTDEFVLGVTCDGYAGAVARLAFPLPESHVFVLAKGVAIRGRVDWGHWEGPYGVGAGVLVLAWPSGYPLDHLDVDPGAARAPCVCATQTAEDGSFVLYGLDSAGTYTLGAFGAGLLATKYAITAKPSAEGEVALAVDQLFGHIMRLTDPRGGALRATAGAYGPRGAMFADDGNAPVETVSPTPFEVRMAGIDVDSLGLDGWASRVLLLIGPPTQEESSLLRFQADIPGYEIVSVTFSAKRLDRGLAETSVALVPVARDFGSVFLRINSSPQARHVDGQMNPTGILTLYSTTGSRFTYPLVDCVSDVYQFDGVPAGDYRAAVSLRNGLTNEEAISPEGTVHVGASHAPFLDLDLGALGSIACQVVDPRGRPYEGRATFLVEPKAGEKYLRTHPLHFSRGPYELVGFPAGEYRVHWSAPNNADPSLGGSVDVAVHCGAIVSASLALRPQ